jgi:hypothetical protein
MAEFEIDNELTPIIITQGSDWLSIDRKVKLKPGEAQPVILVSPQTGEAVGDFFVSFVEVDEIEYAQYEGFNSSWLETMFAYLTDGEMTKVQEGVYRKRLKTKFPKGWEG